MFMNASLLLQAYRPVIPRSLFLYIILPYMRQCNFSASCWVYSVSPCLYMYNSNNAKGFRFDQALDLMLIATLNCIITIIVKPLFILGAWESLKLVAVEVACSHSYTHLHTHFKCNVVDVMPKSLFIIWFVV